MSADLEDITQKIKDSYAQMTRLYQDIPAAELEAPVFSNGWSVKDTLAHIAAWEWRCASLLEQLPDIDGPFKARPDVEALNREFYQEYQDWSWVDVEIYFRRVHRALLAAIRQLPSERIQDPLIQKTIARDSWEHYADHLPDLKDWHEQLIDEDIHQGAIS